MKKKELISQAGLLHVGIPQAGMLLRRGLTITIDLSKLSLPQSSMNDSFSLNDPFSSYHQEHAIVENIVFGKKSDSKNSLAEPVQERDIVLECSAHRIITVLPRTCGKIIITGQGNGHLATHGIELFVGKDADITVIFSEESIAQFTYSFFRSQLDENARVSFIELSAGIGINPGTHLIRDVVHLKGRGSHFDQKVLVAPGHGDQVDAETKIVNDAKETFSRLDVTGIVGKNGKAVSEGHVHLTKNAAESEGIENLHLLLVGENASGNAIPILTIDRGEVSCSHAAKITPVDEQALYYLTSRGLSPDQARNIFIEGFMIKHTSTLPLRIRELFSEKVRRSCIQ
jgi:hypothetical protein